MIPYLLAAVGGYLIGDSMKSQKLDKFADDGVMANGGKIKSELIPMVEKQKDGESIIDFDRTMTINFTGTEKELSDKIDEITKSNRNIAYVQKRIDGKRTKLVMSKYYLSDKLDDDEYAKGGVMANGGQLSSKQLQMLNAGFTFTIFTDYDNHFISIEKVNNKIEYIVRKGRVFDSKKVKSFNSKEEAFSFLSSKAGRKIGTRED